MNVFKDIESLLLERYSDWGGKEQFKGTSTRLKKMLEEMYWTSSQIDEEINKALGASFEESYNQMLVEGPVSVWTLCPHHLLPCHLEVQIGYIPNGRVLGLSKFSRVAVALGKRPTMQEQYSRELADTLWEKLSPDGLGVYVVGSHGCIVSRGVLQRDVRVSTSTLKGSFLDDPGVREEFFSIARK